ncbi:MAG: phage tail sheath subtilisin-like domain-containing protein [Nitrospiraceae bacterium]|nr:phage tail sheath subtilisin-like domain-containing protein [Nitrospiraceae bacterium]
MAEAIQFSQIPSGIRKPGKYFEFNTSLAVRTLPGIDWQVLIIGQRLAAGSVAALVPTQVFSEQDAETYFGIGSIAHRMVRAALQANPYLKLTVCTLDDAAASVAASGTVTIANAATSTGVLSLYVANEEVDVVVNSGDTPTIIAGNIVTAITNLPDLPVTASAALGVVTLTAKNKGTVGNQIGMGYLLQNVSATTVTIVQMANGTTDPTLQNALNAVFAQQFDITITPYNTQANLAILKTQLETLSNAIEQRPGVGVYAVTGPLAAATTLAGQVNEGRILGAYLRLTAGTTQQMSAAYELAAAYGAVMASEPDPGRPLNTLALTGISPPAMADRLSRTEQESCLANGVAPLEVGPGLTVQIVRAISTYTLNPAGVPDVSLLDITTIRALDYVRLSCRTRIALRFPREKLNAVKTPPRVRTELLDVLKQLEDLNMVENVDTYLPMLVVQPDGQDATRLDAQIPADIVPGLHIFAGVIYLLLGA